MVLVYTVIPAAVCRVVNQVVLNHCICGVDRYNTVTCYNVSVNDGKYDGAPVIRMGTGKYGSLGVQIYNNTIYWENNGGYTMSLTPDSYWEGPNIKEVSVFNNICKLRICINRRVLFRSDRKSVV